MVAMLTMIWKQHKEIAYFSNKKPNSELLQSTTNDSQMQINNLYTEQICKYQCD